MTRLFRSTVSVGLCFINLSAAADFERAGGEKPALDPPYAPASVPLWATEEAEHSSYHYGTVIAITDTTITLSRPEKKLISDDPYQVVAVPPGPPRTFMLTKELAGGGYKGRQSESDHRLSDIRVGDGVNVTYLRVKNVSTCDTISILNRVTGKIPPRANGKFAPQPKCPPAS